MENGDAVQGPESAGWRELAGGRGMLRLESSVARDLLRGVASLRRLLVRRNRQLSLPPISVIR